MSKIFITGDRTPTMVYPGMVAIEMLRALGQGHEIVTGDNAGVEELVREIAKQAMVPLAIVPTLALETGKPDWDERHTQLAEAGMHVVAIHVDPHSSSVIKSLMAILPDDGMTLRTTAELV